MPDIRKAFGAILFIACTALGGAPTVAQQRWFTIELLIFKNGGTAWQQEDWDRNPELYYPQPLLIASALSSSDDSDTPIKELEFDGALADAAEKLMATGEYRILYSRRWQQGLLKTKDAPNLLITGGNPHGSHYELEGSIKFSVERYLHANANLWFTAFGEPDQRSEPVTDIARTLPSSRPGTTGQTMVSALAIIRQTQRPKQTRNGTASTKILARTLKSP